MNDLDEILDENFKIDGALIKVFQPAQAKAQINQYVSNRVVEGRKAELEDLLNSMNAGTEFQEEQPAYLKSWNLVILRRIKYLEATAQEKET